MESRKLKAVLVAGLIAVAGVIGAVGAALPTASVAGASSFTNAVTACDKAILADQAIAARQLAACKASSVVFTTKCSHKPNVYEIGVADGSDAFLRVGYKPMVYTEASLHVSEATSLCGDPISPSMTPPAPAMTKAQIQALFHSTNSTTTVPATVPASVSASTACSRWISANDALTKLPVGMTVAQASAKLTGLCSRAELTAVLAAAHPSSSAHAVQLALRLFEGELCPANPHTKLCP